eukprot:m51a1_g1276 hypothetical protein (570) ;mRNA; f:108271-110372
MQPLGVRCFAPVAFFAVLCVAPALVSLSLTRSALRDIEHAVHEAQGPGDRHTRDVQPAFQANRQQATPALLPPSSFSVPHLLPRFYQEDRGTCWAFGTMGVIEQSYRANGVAKGFLDPESYVRFSVQAYMIQMVYACQQRPDICDVVGDGVLKNMTDGGEVWWLYSMGSLSDKLLPLAVCPYSDHAHQMECPGMEEALKSNPLRFHVRSLRTAYSVSQIKQQLLTSNSPPSLSTVIWLNVLYFPCNDPVWSQQPGCSADQRVRCPTDRPYGSVWCARQESTANSPEGEFYDHGNMISDGGHAMPIVGYNDDYVTRQGLKGGFILQNSWHDLTYGQNPFSGRGPRGSHSVAYWMQQISAWQEKALCPNPLNPDNWLSCVNQMPSHGARARNEHGDYNLERTCLNDRFMEYLISNTLQPHEFVCLDAGTCSTDPKYRWFLIDSERSVEQDLMKISMLRYDPATKEQRVVTTPLVNPLLIPYMWAPIKAQQERLKNDEDFCGYYFIPYQTFDRMFSMFPQTTNSFLFDIEWDDSSYLSNAGRFPQYDYSLVKMSTGTQKQLNFGPTPSPFVH